MQRNEQHGSEYVTSSFNIFCFRKIIFPLQFIFRSMSFLPLISITPAPSASLGFFFPCFPLSAHSVPFGSLFLATFSMRPDSIASGLSEWGIFSHLSRFFCFRFSDRGFSFHSKGIKKNKRFHYIDTDSKTYNLRLKE